MSNKIKESNISDGAVTSNKIAPGTIAADRLAGSITNDQLAGSIANAKLANSSITINGTSIALGASGNIVAGTDWQAVVTADGSTVTTASAGEGYFINTTSNAHTINLPASPSQGDEVHIIDYAGTFGTNNVTVGRNSSNIDGSAIDITLSTNRLASRFVYIDATEGWRVIIDDESTNYSPTYVSATGGTVTTDGDYKIHTFTSSGCFVVSQLGNSVGGGAIVDYLVIGGGAAGQTKNARGATDYGQGGGGAGGFRESKSPLAGTYTASPLATSTGLTVTATTYPVTVGAGSSSPSVPQACSTSGPGSNSVFSTITSTGGGGGGYGGSPSSNSTAGGSGGSGGGGGSGPNGSGGSGNNPPVSPPQGNSGGTGTDVADTAAGGGGGAGATGGNGTASSSPRNNNAGDGGAGVATAITGTSTSYAGGGGGGSGYPVCGGGAVVPGTGGTGGGGDGGGPPSNPVRNTTCGEAGTANTGSGGGGAGGTGATGVCRGGAGGSGVVIIRYKYQ